MPTVLITGANRGLGLEFARQYAGDGWRVIATCRDPGGAADLKERDGDCRALEMDVTNGAPVGKTRESFDGEDIDLLN